MEYNSIRDQNEGKHVRKGAGGGRHLCPRLVQKAFAVELDGKSVFFMFFIFVLVVL